MMHSRTLTTSMFLAAAALASAFEQTPVDAVVVPAMTLAQMQTYSDAGWRPTSIQSEGYGNSLTHTVAWVRNMGAHQRSWFFAAGKTWSQIQNDYPGWEAADVEIQTSGTNSRYSVLFFNDNVPSRIVTSSSAGTLNTLAANGNERIVDVDGYVLNGQQRYSAVLRKRQTGDPSVNIVSKINGFSNLSDIVVGSNRWLDLDEYAAGQYVGVIESMPGQRVGYFAGTSLTGMRELAKNTGSRVEAVNRKTINGTSRYSGVLVTNVNAETGRVLDLMLPQTDGKVGVYAREIGVQTLVGSRHTERFHPSSTIKALFAYHAFMTTPSGQLSTRLIPVWPNHTSDNHAGERAVQTPQVDVIQPMMYNSNNQMANALMDFFGRPALNARGVALGMESTTIRNKMGTGGPYGNPDNFTETSLTDLGLLYRETLIGSTLSQARKDLLKAWMLNDTNTSLFGTVAGELKTSLGLTNSEYNAWRAALRYQYKAGSNSSGGITGYLSIAGSASLPFRSGGATTYRRFVFGCWVNNAQTKNNVSLGTISGESLRPVLRQSLLSFKGGA